MSLHLPGFRAGARRWLYLRSYSRLGARGKETVMEEILRIDKELNIFVHDQIVVDDGPVATALREFYTKGYFLPVKKLIESPGFEPTQKLIEPSGF